MIGFYRRRRAASPHSEAYSWPPVAVHPAGDQSDATIVKHVDPGPCPDCTPSRPCTLCRALGDRTTR